MTIAAGFKCCDGILLCSDTMYSGKLQEKEGPKLWLVHEDNPVVAFGGASRNVGALLAARDRVERRMKPGMSLERVTDTIDAVLLQISKKFPFPGDPAVQALVAIRVEDETRMFVNEAGDTSLSPAINDSICLGVDDLGDYFAKKLFRDGMSLEWAKVVAAHLVANCKQYASGYCGLDTDMIVIPNAGRPDVIRGKSNVHIIKALESYLDGIDAAYDAILPFGSPMESSPDESLRGRANAIKEAIKQAAITDFLSAPSGYIALTGHPPTVEIRRSDDDEGK